MRLGSKRAEADPSASILLIFPYFLPGILIDEERQLVRLHRVM